MAVPVESFHNQAACLLSGRAVRFPTSGGREMEPHEVSQSVSVRSWRRGLSRRILFWSEIMLLMAAVGFSAALLTHDYSTAQARKTAPARFDGNSHFRCVRASDPSYQTARRTPEVSWFRHLFGDEAVSLILLPRNSADDAELAHMRALFPEAQVEWFPIR
jgi:hypothetical protein